MSTKPKSLKQTHRTHQPNKLQSQLEFTIERPVENDRNFHKGGRSFYFFDFDDNIAILPTETFIFHKETAKPLKISSGDFARYGRSIGLRGEYKDYQINFDDKNGTFKNFRDHESQFLGKFFKRKQSFVKDIEKVLKLPDYEWKGPSWSCFYHAVYNQRPLSLITARGHYESTIKEGVRLLYKKGHLPCEPNYLSIFPVSNPEVRAHFSGDKDLDVAALKGRAIQASFYRALEVYGDNPHHRFGMSDDDPKNIELITREMSRLKGRYPEMSFYAIETHKGQFIKREIFKDKKSQTRKSQKKTSDQMSFL